MKRKKNKAIVLTVYKETGEEKRWKYPLLLSATLIIGMALVIIPAFQSIPLSPWIFAAGGTLLCVPLVFLFQSRPKDIWLIVVVAACAAFCAIFFAKVKSGTLILTNDFLDFWTTKTGRIFLDFETGLQSDVIYICIILWVLLCAFTVKAAISSRPWFLLFPLSFCAAGIAIGFFPVSYGIAFLAFALLFLAIRGNQLKKDPGCPENGFFIHAAAAALGALIVLAGFLFSDLPTESILGSAKKTYHELRYDDQTNSMPEGDLSDLSGWEASFAPALAVSAETYSKLYLRGFTGEVYTGTAWESLDTETLAEYKNTFYWLHKDGFFAQSMIANAESITGSEEASSLSIENISACKKYAYFPYSVTTGELMDPLFIGDVSVKGAQYEDVTYYPGSLPQWYAMQQQLSATQTKEETAAYLMNEQQYRDFAYEYYLQLTPTAVRTLKKYLDSDEQSRSLSEIRQIILKFLDEKLVYDENAKVLNGKSDFLTCLLEQTKKGYSVSYATAAVLMLRYYGVPARYVEGYHLSREEAESLPGGMRYVLDEMHAHAWAEYYLDGIGWLPFEVTPGYIDESEYELGEGANEEESMSYEHNELVYTITEQPQPMEEESGPTTTFRIPPKMYLLLLVLLLAVLIGIVLIRRGKLKKTLDRIKSSGNKACIAALYGYADMLLEKAKISKHVNETADVLNNEAMFSNHRMSDGQKEEMISYVDEVIQLCKQKWNVFLRFYYRFVKCLYL